MAVILSSIKIEKYGMRVVKLFGVYLFVSMLAMFTLFTLGNEPPSILTLVLYPIISVFVVVIGLASSFHELRKEAMQTQDWELLLLARREETFQGFLILIGVVLYIVACFVPAISVHALTEFLFRVVDWVYNLPIIGLIIGVGGILFLLQTIFYGLVAVMGLYFSLFSKSKSDLSSPDQSFAEVDLQK